MGLKIMECKRCGHEWASKAPNKIKVCPKCKSPWWNVERKAK